MPMPISSGSGDEFRENRNLLPMHMDDPVSATMPRRDATIRSDREEVYSCTTCYKNDDVLHRVSFPASAAIANGGGIDRVGSSKVRRRSPAEQAMAVSSGQYFNISRASEQEIFRWQMARRKALGGE